MLFPDKKIAWMAALSLALHIGLIFGLHIPLPEAHAPAVLEARLENVAAPPPVAAPRAKPRPRANPSAEPARKAPVPEPEPLAAKNDLTAAPSEKPDPVVAPAPPVELSAPPKPAETTLPMRAELRYTLFKGENALNVGKVVQTWKRVDDSYTLTSIAEASGLFSLFVSGRHVQVSKGRITAAGLQPESFSMQRGRTDKTDVAHFDWAGQTLHLNSEGRESSVKLVPGVLDLLSFTYQFAFSLPESGDIPINLTNGRKLDAYRYRIVAEENLDTPLGVLKTLHLTKLHLPGEDGTEIWLGMDYHYLPVKIRQIDKKGDSAEQVITEIRYE